MKGIILAGGSGSRLLPLTKVTNKHLLPVGGEPMIFHPVKKLIGAGIRDILVVTGCDHMGDVVGVLGSGRDFECEFPGSRRPLPRRRGAGRSPGRCRSYRSRR